MAEIKRCDRCKKLIEPENEILAVAEINTVRITRGYIKTSPKFATLGENGKDIEYLPLVFSKPLLRETDLCTQCLEEFRNFISVIN